MSGSRVPILMRLLTRAVNFFTAPMAVPTVQATPEVTSDQPVALLQASLDIIIASAYKAKWELQEADRLKAAYFETKIRKRPKVSATKVSDILEAQLAAHGVPYKRSGHRFRVFCHATISIEAAKQMNQVILDECQRISDKKNEEGEGEEEEKLQGFTLAISPAEEESNNSVSGLAQEEYQWPLTQNQLKVSPSSSPRVSMLFSPSQSINTTSEDDLSSPEVKQDKSNVQVNKKALKKSPTANTLSANRRMSITLPATHSATASAVTSPVPSSAQSSAHMPSHEPIVWTHGGNRIVYDEDHPENSDDVHEILASGKGRQFLLFTLKPDDFTNQDAYTAMRGIADHPMTARQRKDQGVIFLGEQKLTSPIEKMKPQQRARLGVKKDKAGNEFIPTVKLKILGDQGRGDVRDYGFSVKTKTNEVLNIVTVVNEDAHKEDERHRKK
jgi:hypothetical protein